MTLEVGMLLFPDLTQLDLTAPYELFHRVPGARVHLVWHHTQPVVTQGGMQIVPSVTFANSPKLDLLFVPGGFGQKALRNDKIVLDYLVRQAQYARYVTSVCTGSLVLGAAGLLEGYKATTHWAYLQELAEFGAIPTQQRVVVDRNRITGAGVTSGLDFGLEVVAALGGAELAQTLQLSLEYDPKPPYSSGSPMTADPKIVQLLRDRYSLRAKG